MRRVLAPFVLVGMFGSIGVFGSGCGNDTSDLSSECGPNAPCAEGYTCSAAGRCIEHAATGLADAGSTPGAGDASVVEFSDSGTLKPDTYDVAVTADSGGHVTTDPALSCSGNSCRGRVNADAELAVTATPEPGYRLIGWSGGAGCSGTANPLHITVTAELTCRATFVRFFTVAVSAVGAPAPVSVHVGTCQATSCSADEGAAATFTAPTVDGYRFAGWSGDPGCTGSADALRVVIAAATACQANYVVRDLAVSVTGTLVGGTGEINASSTSPGAMCNGARCSVTAGGAVTLTAPDLTPGARFLGWSGDSGCTGSGRAVTITNVRTAIGCTATYVARGTVGATVPAGEVGSAAVRASSGDPTAVCSVGSCTVDLGQTVVLAASDIAGYRFTGWSGSGCTGAASVLTVMATATPRTCQADYVAVVHVAAAVSGTSASVMVTSDSSGASCAGDRCSVDQGGMVMLTAPELEPSYRFVSWAGAADCVGTARELILEDVRVDTDCTAQYVRRRRIRASSSTGSPLQVTSDAQATLCSDGICTVDDGAEITIAAPAEVDGRLFTEWTGGGPCSGSANPLVFSAVNDEECIAVYKRYFEVAVQVGSFGESAPPPPNVTVNYGSCHAASCNVAERDQATLEAPPIIDTKYVLWSFASWTGDPACDRSQESTLTVTVTGPIRCTAHYEPGGEWRR